VIVAFCIGQLATRIPAAGGFYSYAAITFGNAFGFIVGWLYSALYVILVCVSGINFALVTQDFLSYYFHFAPPYWLLVAIIVLVLLGGDLHRRPVSTGLTAVLGIIEVGIILLLTIILIAKAGDANSFALFTRARRPARVVHPPLRLPRHRVRPLPPRPDSRPACRWPRETKNPKRTVPLALMLSAGLIGAFYVLATYAAIIGWGTAHLSGYIDSPNAWRVMGGKISAVLAVLVSLAIINSTIGGEQSGYNAVSRLLYAMGRAATLPKALARIHAQRRTPYVAVVASGLLALALMYIAMALFSPFGAFVFFLTLGSFYLPHPLYRHRDRVGGVHVQPAPVGVQGGRQHHCPDPGAGRAPADAVLQPQGARVSGRPRAAGARRAYPARYRSAAPAAGRGAPTSPASASTGCGRTPWTRGSAPRRRVRPRPTRRRRARDPGRPAAAGPARTRRHRRPRPYRAGRRRRAERLLPS
jgi:hypothetical protein